MSMSASGDEPERCCLYSEGCGASSASAAPPAPESRRASSSRISSADEGRVPMDGFHRGRRAGPAGAAGPRAPGDLRRPRLRGPAGLAAVPTGTTVYASGLDRDLEQRSPTRSRCRLGAGGGHRGHYLLLDEQPCAVRAAVDEVWHALRGADSPGAAPGQAHGLRQEPGRRIGVGRPGRRAERAPVEASAHRADRLLDLPGGRGTATASCSRIPTRRHTRSRGPEPTSSSEPSRRIWPAPAARTIVASMRIATPCRCRSS